MKIKVLFIHGAGDEGYADARLVKSLQDTLGANFELSSRPKKYKVIIPIPERPPLH